MSSTTASAGPAVTISTPSGPLGEVVADVETAPSPVNGGGAKPVGESGAGLSGTRSQERIVSPPTSPTKSTGNLMPSATANSAASQPPPSSFAAHPEHRGRSISNATTASALSVATTASAATTDSTYSTATVVPSKRQRDFEKLFGPQLRPFRAQERPEDFLTVLQTQSADLQASVLLHGRLYLTAYYLCFRSNIVGYVTEKIYDLRDIIVVERSTTAKWIQNAVSLTVLEDGAEVVVGYGSMGDREAMYEGITEVWRARAPERYEQYQTTVARQAERDERNAEKDRAKARSGSTASVPESASSASISSDDQELQPRASISTIRSPSTEAAAASVSTPIPPSTARNDTDAKAGNRDRAVSEVRHTESSGEKYDVEAVDTKIGIPMEQLYQLMYHNKEFQREFMEDVQGLTDVRAGEWAEVGGKKERTLNSVMHMNNSIGPKKSDCNSLERVEVEDPEKAYEVVSETQTPDIPSGKSFKIRTRTCLSHTGVDDNQTPATRLHCTTQCDWSASSMLKSAITPAVIKGQKEYHAKLVKAIKDWIAKHPSDFETGPPAGVKVDTGGSQAAKTDAPAEQSARDGAGVKTGGNTGILIKDKADDYPKNNVDDEVDDTPASAILAFLAGLPFSVWISALCALSLSLNFILLTGRL